MHLLLHILIVICLITEAIVLSNNQAWGEIERVQLKHNPPQTHLFKHACRHTHTRVVNKTCQHLMMCSRFKQFIHEGQNRKKKDKHRGASLICYLKWRTVDIIAFYLVYINTLGTHITYGYNNVLIAHHFTDCIRCVSLT